MVTHDHLKIWVIDALKALGPAPVPRIAQHIWENHETELRQSDDMFYTWQYAMRWAGQRLQIEGKLTKKGTGRTWALV
jgi:hypothetical protein